MSDKIADILEFMSAVVQLALIASLLYPIVIAVFCM